MTTRLLLEVGRRVPHSYAVVAQGLRGAFAGQSEVALRYVESRGGKASWEPVGGLVAPNAVDASARNADSGGGFDAGIRISFPYELREVPDARRTFVLATCEYATTNADNFTAPLSVLGGGRLELLTPSRWSKEGLVRTGAAEGLVHVVPHGFDPGIFSPLCAAERARARSELGWSGSFVFLHVGSMAPNKGLSAMLSAFARVAVDHPEARLVLKGLDAFYDSSKYYERALAACLSGVDARRVRARTVFWGTAVSSAAIARLLQAADVYLAPYLAEGFNLPVLEAAACALPVICTLGGPTDDFTSDSFRLGVRSSMGTVVTPGKQCLIPCQDDLVAQMNRALVERSWMERARAEAAPFVHRRYTWRHVADGILGIVRLGS